MEKKKVLFLCIGNSCRSPMAEAFGLKYGQDVMEVMSAGLAPASIVQPLTHKVLQDKAISTDDLFPKSLSEVEDRKMDLIVNMSGHKLPVRDDSVEVRDWAIQDPIGLEEEVYVKVRDEIERQVMLLILELRRKAKRGVSRQADTALSSKN